MYIYNNRDVICLCNLINSYKGNSNENDVVGYDILYYKARDSREILFLRDSIIKKKDCYY